MMRVELLEELAERAIAYARDLGTCAFCDMGDESHCRSVEAGIEGHDRDCPVQKVLEDNLRQQLTSVGDEQL